MPLPEVLAGAAAKPAVEALARFALEIPKKGLLRQWKLDEARQATQRYQQRFAEAHGYIHFIGTHEPIPIREVYTAVRVADNVTSYATREELEQMLRSERRRSFSASRPKTEDGMHIANQEPFLNVLGGPGAGKSTFLRRVGLEALILPGGRIQQLFRGSESAYQHSCLPVFIELKLLKFKKIDLIALIETEFESCGFPKGFGKAALEKGKLLILLDGLDEVPLDKLPQVNSHIQKVVNDHDENRYITSCRTAFYKTYFARFTDVVLTEFDDNQIQNFIQNWFRSEEHKKHKTATKFWRSLQKEENSGSLDLARTPLLLTFLCVLVDDRGHNLPSTRSTLYKRALEILLERWAAHKLVHQEPVYAARKSAEVLRNDLELVMLAKIAGVAFADDKLFFNQDELVKSIEEFLRTTRNTPKGLNGREVLEDIEVRQGLLVQRAHNIYSFSHLTLQEYLAASYYASPKRTKKIVDEHLFNVRWLEVFQLLAGMESVAADELLSQMTATLHTFNEGRPYVGRIIDWVSKHSKTVSDVEDCAVRRVVLFSVARIFLAAQFLKIDARTFIQSHHAKGYEGPKYAGSLNNSRAPMKAADARIATDNRSAETHKSPEQQRSGALQYDAAEISRRLDISKSEIKSQAHSIDQAVERELELQLDRSLISAFAPQYIGLVVAAGNLAASVVRITAHARFGLHFEFSLEADYSAAATFLEGLGAADILNVDLKPLAMRINALIASAPPPHAVAHEKVKFAKDFLRELSNGIGLEPSLSNASLDDHRAAADCLYGLLVIAKGKDATFNLEIADWQQIAAGILRPTGTLGKSDKKIAVSQRIWETAEN